jgi:hypothetical protein
MRAERDEFRTLLMELERLASDSFLEALILEQIDIRVQLVAEQAERLQ